MHAEKDNQQTLIHAEKTAFVERARELLKGFDLMDAEQLQGARALLEREGIPQWTIFSVGEATPITEAEKRWASRRIQELRDSGEFS